MVLDDTGHKELAQVANNLKASGAPFVVATVVRTVSVTAAKPGAKAIISADGDLLSGWIGGGCARHAVIVAAKKSLQDAQPRLVQLQPEELLNEQGLVAGSDDNGVLVARNMCPSQGTMDIFVEPVLSNPELLVLGRSPIALAVSELGPRCGFSVSSSVISSAGSGTGSDAKSDTGTDNVTEDTLTDLADIPHEHAHRYIVIATQGSSDLDTIKKALSLEARHIAFVGSRRKLSHLREKLHAEGYSTDDSDKLTGPAGLDIGAVTPQEIALSILSEIVQIRRSDRPR
jgi:xanthine dehydrogenase accessory factor